MVHWFIFAGTGENTIADQLKAKLEERRRSREEIPASAQSVKTKYSPQNIAANVQQAVQLANEVGKSNHAENFCS